MQVLIESIPFSGNVHLSLVPPSCMVAPMRDLGNKLFSFSFNMHFQQSSQLPTVFLTNCIGMDSLSSGPSSNNVDEVRGRTPTSKSLVSRDSSMSSTKSLVAYHERMENNNDIDVDDVSSELALDSTQGKSIHVSEATNTVKIVDGGLHLFFFFFVFYFYFLFLEQLGLGVISHKLMA